MAARCGRSARHRQWPRRGSPDPAGYRAATGELGLQALDELIVDGTLHVQPRVGRTHLALVEENAEGGLFRSQVQVLAIVEHQVWALAAALQPHLLEVGLRRVLHEVLAHLGGAGEYQAVHIRVQAQRLPGLLAQARHHVQYAFRQPRFQRQLGHAQGRKR